MYKTVFTANGITYTQEGPAVLTGDRNLLKLEGVRRICAEITLVRTSDNATICTLKSALPLSPSAGKVITFDMTDALRQACNIDGQVDCTLTVKPQMVASGTIDDWQPITPVNLNYYIRPGRTLPDRSYCSEMVIPVFNGETIEYYSPGTGEGVLDVSGDDFNATNTWGGVAYDGTSTKLTFSLQAPETYVRGNLENGYSTLSTWSVKLWKQPAPSCVPYARLRWRTADGCKRSLWVELQGRENSSDGLEWHDTGLVRNTPMRTVTRTQVDYTLLVRNVPPGVQLGDIVYCEHLYLTPVAGSAIRVALADAKMTENIYKSYDYLIKVSVIW